MKKVFLFFGVIVLLFLSSCRSTQQEVTYFQDLEINRPVLVDTVGTIRMEADDQISIIVTCKDPELTALFNLVSPQYYLGGANSSSSYNRVSYYTIDANGYIDFPVIGKVHVAGLTRQEVADKVKDLLVKSGQIANPVVTVEFANLTFSILGEVKSAGKYNITRNRTTILDAISMAGDLNITGLRGPIYLIREKNGKRITYNVDVRSKDLFKSPAYYIKQNDVIYIRPNKMRAGQSTINENTFSNVSFWVTFCSFLTSVGVLVFK